MRSPKTSRRAMPALFAVSGLVTIGMVAGATGRGFGSHAKGPFYPVRMATPSPFVLALYRALEPDFPSKASEEARAASLLGEHTLTFNSTDESELTNVLLSVRAIDGVVVPPGAVFSFNDTVGERSVDRGFREGLMYVAGQVVSGVGGGVCIPSTAVYNAALNAGMEIVERYPHSGPVSYAEPGLDAAVVFGQKDLRFRNTSPEPVVIHANILGDTLSVQLTGKPMPGQRIVVERVGLGSLPFEEQKVTDPEAPQGQPSVEQTGRSGYTVTVIRTFYRGDKVLRRETVSHDVIAPRPQIVHINPLDDPNSPESLETAKTDAAAAQDAAAAETPGAPAAPNPATPESEPLTVPAEKATRPAAPAADVKAPERAETARPKAEPEPAGHPTPKAEAEPAKLKAPVAPAAPPVKTPELPAKASALKAPADPTPSATVTPSIPGTLR